MIPAAAAPAPVIVLALLVAVAVVVLFVVAAGWLIGRPEPYGRRHRGVTADVLAWAAAFREGLR